MALIRKLCLFLVMCFSLSAVPAAAQAMSPCEGTVAVCFAPLGPGTRVSKALRVSRIYGWRTLDPLHGILWLGVEEPYLAVLEPGCAGLEAPVRLEAVRSRRLTPGKDHLSHRGMRCRIDALYELDVNRVPRPGKTGVSSRPGAAD